MKFVKLCCLGSFYLALGLSASAQGQLYKDRVADALTYWRCAILGGYAADPEISPDPDTQFQKGFAIFRQVLSDRAEGRLSEKDFEALPSEFVRNLGSFGFGQDSVDFQLGVLWQKLSRNAFGGIQATVSNSKVELSLPSIAKAAVSIHKEQNCRMVR